MTFGSYLLQLRERADRSKTDLARALLPPVTVTYISAVEDGKVKPLTVERCQQAARFLDASPAELQELIRLASVERSPADVRLYLERAFSGAGIVREEVPAKKNYIAVPLLDSCPASEKQFSNDEIERWIELPKEEVRNRRVYLLKIKGDSMNRAGIEDGDTVFVVADEQPKNGNIVIARIDEEECTCKRFYRTDAQITLMPDSTNMKHQPMIFSRSTHVQIRGVVEAVWMKRLK